MALRAHTHRGFSLVELIVSIGILSVFLAGLFTFFRAQVFAYRTEEARLRLKVTADTALDFIVNEIRMAGSRPEAFDGGTCAPPGGPAAVSPVCVNIPGVIEPGFRRIVTALPTSIRVLYDYTGSGTTPTGADGCPDDAEEDITYAFNAGTGEIVRSTVSPAQTGPVADNVTAFSLTYFDLLGAQLVPPLSDTDLENVHRIDVSMSLNSGRVDAFNAGLQTTRTAATIYLRNPPC